MPFGQDRHGSAMARHKVCRRGMQDAAWWLGSEGTCETWADLAVLASTWSTLGVPKRAHGILSKQDDRISRSPHRGMTATSDGNIKGGGGWMVCRRRLGSEGQPPVWPVGGPRASSDVVPTQTVNTGGRREKRQLRRRFALFVTGAQAACLS